MKDIKLGIKDRHPLVDLVTHGSSSRRSMRPEVLIGNYPPGHSFFKEGDILDANAVWNLILNNPSNTCRCNDIEKLNKYYYDLLTRISDLQDKHDDEISELDDKLENI